MQTIVLYLCYIVLILLFSYAYNTSLIYCFVIWCLHTNTRRPCSSTLSGHPSSSWSFICWDNGSWFAAFNTYFLSVPLNFIQSDYVKAGYVKGAENFKDVSHVLNSFLLRRLPLYFWSYFFTISRASVLCTDFCSLHGKKQVYTIM